VSEEEIALKLTEIKYKNYTFHDYCDTYKRDVVEYYIKALKRIRESK
jgi:hypothetical protein